VGGDGPRTAADLVRGRAGERGTGLLFEGREWTWAQVVDEAAARAALLQAARTDGPFHVGVLLENTPEYLFTLAGAALAGAVVVGLNPTRRGEELAADVRATDCQLVLTDAAGAPLLDGLDLGIDGDRVWVTDGPAHAERVAVAAGSTPAPTSPAPEDLYLLIFTSGSTGRPKAVRMTQGRAARAAARIPFSPDDVLYSAMPLFHGNALAAAVFPAFATGATVALRRRFSASGFLPDIRATGATFFNTVGRAISHILATPPTDHDRDHQLKFVLGPETSAPDKAAFTERFGPPVFEGYGSSENAIVLQPATRARPGALGRAAEGDDIVVIDPATDRECPRATFDDDGRLTNAAEAIGELVGRNVRSAFEGYYNNPEAEAERTRNGWYWSGDLAYRDEDGTFYFAGRTGDWLRVDSENFAAAPIERILGRWEALRGVAVYPVPDPASGDQVMAAVEMVDGVDFDPDGLRDFLAAQPDLGTKWAPRYVRVVAALPATGTDKVDKQPLRRQKWDTEDPLWHRVGRGDDYVPMTADDVAGLHAAFEATGRTDLL
jgi:fatty-acyl-CoA synthase